MKTSLALNPFEVFAADYDDWFEKHPFAYQSELDLIRYLTPTAGNGLEIGTGTGRFAVPLNIRTGIEPSLQMKSIAEEKGITVYPARAEELPFADHAYDYVLMVTTICFLDDVQRSLSEIHRVLSPAGCLIVGFVDSNSSLGRQYLQKRSKSRFYRHARFYSSDEVISLLRSNGYIIEDIRQTLFMESTDLNKVETHTAGFGLGSFIGIKAKIKGV